MNRTENSWQSSSGMYSAHRRGMMIGVTKNSSCGISATFRRASIPSTSVSMKAKNSLRFPWETKGTGGAEQNMSSKNCALQARRHRQICNSKKICGFLWTCTLGSGFKRNHPSWKDNKSRAPGIEDEFCAIGIRNSSLQGHFGMENDAAL